jgi:hypothetical protein
MFRRAEGTNAAVHLLMTEKVRRRMRHRLRASFCSAKLHSPQETDTEETPIGNLRQPNYQ